MLFRSQTLPEVHTENASEMALRIVVRSETNFSVSDAIDIVDAIIGALLSPGIRTFAAAAAVIVSPLGWVEQKLSQGGMAMPNEWYPVVLATSSDDGKFFVGRILREKSRLTHADALRFLAVEKDVPPAAEDATARLLSADEARERLIEHYVSNQSILDKVVAAAVTSTIGGASLVAGAAVGATAATFKALGSRLRRGF